MKCSACGAYNKYEYTKCYRCGTTLASDSDANKKDKILLEHKSPLKNTPSFRQTIIVESRPEQEMPQKIKTERQIDSKDKTNNDLWSMNTKKKPFFIRKNNTAPPVVALKNEFVQEDTDSTDSISKTKNNRIRKRAAKGTNLDKLSHFTQGSEIDVILPPEEKRKREKKEKEKSKLKWGRLIVVSVVAASIIIGLVIGFFYLFQGVFSGVTSLFSGHEELPNDGEPLVERLMINGQSWHRITFYGEDGERILIEDPIRSLSIQDGKSILLLDDFSYIPTSNSKNEEELPFIEVALKASKFSKNGDETLLNVPSYNIEVPLSPLKIVYPTDISMVVENTQVLVKIKVEPGSRVIIDNFNLTDIVDSDGYVTKFVNLESGINKIRIRVETYKHRAIDYDITVEQPAMDVPINLNSPDSSSLTEDVNIEGITEPGASIYVDTYNLSADVDLDQATGEFKFRYKLNAFGWNEIAIEATTKDGRKSTLIHRIERIPNHREYTKAAHKMDYEQLSTIANSIVGRIFKCSGEIQKRIETDTSRMYLFNVGGDKLQFIMIEYNGKQDFEIGKKYDVYADVSGTYENYPLLTGRFIYLIEDKAEETTETN